MSVSFMSLEDLENLPDEDKDQKCSYAVLLKRFDIEQYEWSKMLNRLAPNGKTVRQGMCIKYEGTEGEFDKLLDELYSKNNIKVIGVYNN